MNTEVMFSSKSDMWATPQDFYDKLDQEFNFTCDVCSIPEDAKHKNFYSPEKDGLAQEWSGVCFCNPPYSDISSWTKKAVTEAYRGVTIVMLIPSRTDTKYFQNDILRYSVLSPESKNFTIETELRFVPGRLKFGNRALPSWTEDGTHKLSPAPFPSVVVIWRRKKKEEKMKGLITDWNIVGGHLTGYCKEHPKIKVNTEIKAKITRKNIDACWAETENTRWILV